MMISISAAKPALSEAQREYRKFVAAALKEHKKAHPFEGTDEEVADFLSGISEGWAAYKKERGIETKG